LLTLYRGNRAELLAELLAVTLRLDPPGPFEQVRVVVNTWPTSRWLGEQLALGLDDPDAASDFAGGVAANLRFPFPGSYLRELVDALLAEAEPAASGVDPWRATALVWPLLELLPALVKAPEAQLLRSWLARRGHGGSLAQLDLSLWQLARAIADASTITPSIDRKCWPPGALVSSSTEAANRCGPCSGGSRCCINCWPPASASPPSPCGCGGPSSCSGSGWKRAYRGRQGEQRLRIWRPCRCRARSGCLV
jgi:hypothetical protein